MKKTHETSDSMIDRMIKYFFSRLDEEGKQLFLSAAWKAEPGDNIQIGEHVMTVSAKDLETRNIRMKALLH